MSRAYCPDPVLLPGLLSGSVTQIRVPVRPQPWWDPAGDGLPGTWRWEHPHAGKLGRYACAAIQDVPEEELHELMAQFCPLGGPVGLLWVQETFSMNAVETNVVYRQREPGAVPFLGSWVPAARMPKWASRLTLKIGAVRAERLHQVDEAAAEACGAWPAFQTPEGTVTDRPLYRYGFARLWDARYRGTTLAWGANPLVWVLDVTSLGRNVGLVETAQRCPAAVGGAA